MRNRLSFFILAVLMTFPGVVAEGEGYKASITQGDVEIPVIVVSGSPFEMGKSLGELTADASKALLQQFVAVCQTGEPEKYSDAQLDAAWEAVAPHTDPRFKEEMKGLAEGAGIPLELIQRAHMLPVVSEYSCSSIAAWGPATKDGHLYQTRNLDWDMQVGAHKFPCIVIYRPSAGIAHVNVSFAGYLGSHTGLSTAGIALAEMGDSPSSEYPYDVNGEHFTTLFRRVMYDAKNLDEAVAMFKSAKRIKRYHYVVGDGKNMCAVKMLAHAPNLRIWKDNDPTDELAPNIMEHVVYQDEGRGAFPMIKERYGEITAEDMIKMACSIPIKGGNVLDVVYDATSLELWVSYAKDETEAYLRPFVHLDIKQYLK